MPFEAEILEQADQECKIKMIDILNYLGLKIFLKIDILNEIKKNSLK